MNGRVPRYRFLAEIQRMGFENLPRDLHLVVCKSSGLTQQHQHTV
jgi:hypothetical protein